MRNSTVEDYFKNLGYKVKELPQSISVCTSHPNRLYKFGIQYVIAAIRCYPRLYDFFAENTERYKTMLNGQKAVMMELYQMHGSEGRKIDYYSPIENAKEFWLTPYPAPLLKGMTEDRPKKD